MDPRIAQLAAQYRAQHARYSSPQEGIAALQARYEREGENTLLEAAGAAIGLQGIVAGEKALTPQMREAFGLAYPNVDLDVLLEGGAEQISGYLNGWRGKYFEVLVRDRLNSGEAVGDIYLLEGQEARLAELANQPGWDLQIVQADGSAAELLQLKATNSLSYVKSALQEHTDIAVLATDEVAAHAEGILASGIDNSTLTELFQPTEVLVGATQSAFLDLLPLLPVVVVLTSEGRYVLVGQKALQDALSDSAVRLAKTGVAMGVGGVVMLLDGGLLSLPATFLARLGVDRVATSARMCRRLEQRAITLEALGAH